MYNTTNYEEIRKAFDDEPVVNNSVVEAAYVLFEVAKLAFSLNDILGSAKLSYWGYSAEQALYALMKRFGEKEKVALHIASIGALLHKDLEKR